MMKRYTIPLLAVLLLLLMGCGQPVGNAIYEDGADMVEAVSGEITQISPKELKEKMDSGEHFVLIDVRDPDEKAKTGWIEWKNAQGQNQTIVDISRGKLEFMFPNRIQDRDTPIVVYCLKGSRGALAAQTLTWLKYSNVINLEGGWQAWEAAYPGLKTEPAGSGIQLPGAAPAGGGATEAASEGGCG